MDKTQQGYLLIAAVVCTFASIFGARLFFDQEQKPNQSTNCVGVPERDTVFLIDGSDEYSQQTYNEIKSRIEQYVFEKNSNGDPIVKTNERVSIFLLSENSDKNLVSLYSGCKPEQDPNQLTQGIKVTKTFNNNFRKPVEDAIEAAIKPIKSTTSPIAHTINDLTLMDVMRGKEKQLIVYSDLLENMQAPAFSLYRCKNTAHPEEEYKKGLNGSIDRPDFGNTRIELNLFPVRQPDQVLQCRTNFWTWYFGKNPATEMAPFQFLPGSLLTTTVTKP